MTAFNTMFAANVNKQVLVDDKASGSQVLYKVARLSDKMGVMKNGDKAEYVILTAQDGTTTVVSLHPQAASALFKKGESNGMKIVEEVKGEEAAPVVEEVKPETVLETADEDKGELQQADEVKGDDKTVVTEEEKTDAPKVLSKKDRTIAIVHAGWDAGQQRKDIIAKLRTELDMGVPGANTYYQNVKSGNWGGRQG